MAKMEIPSVPIKAVRTSRSASCLCLRQRRSFPPPHFDTPHNIYIVRTCADAEQTSLHFPQPLTAIEIALPQRPSTIVITGFACTRRDTQMLETNRMLGALIRSHHYFTHAERDTILENNNQHSLWNMEREGEGRRGAKK